MLGPMSSTLRSDDRKADRPRAAAAKHRPHRGRGADSALAATRGGPGPSNRGTPKSSEEYAGRLLRSSLGLPRVFLAGVTEFGIGSGLRHRPRLWGLRSSFGFRLARHYFDLLPSCGVGLGLLTVRASQPPFSSRLMHLPSGRLLLPPSSTRLERCQSARLLGVFFGCIEVTAPALNIPAGLTATSPSVGLPSDT
jgi:hypothetical protein